jgi:hypothetical protein
MVVLNVKACDRELKAIRESTCNPVLDRFQCKLPGTRLLCFIDDVDFAELKTGTMKGNRGGFMPHFYSSILQHRPPLPQYVKDLYNLSHMLGTSYRSVIYIHGSTCEPRESLIITLAHELEHFTQFSKQLRFYEADFILSNLRGNQPDLPSESDAHLISKRIATDLCGEACIDSYARSQLAIAEEINRPRWEYFLSLPLNDPLTFAEKTKLQCEKNQVALKAMIAANLDYYERGFPRFDFNKPDWWEE